MIDRLIGFGFTDALAQSGSIVPLKVSLVQNVDISEIVLKRYVLGNGNTLGDLYI